MQPRHVFPAVVLFLINVLNFYDRNAPGALAEPMRKEFALSDTQIGLLGGVFIWIYAIVGVPLGSYARLDEARRHFERDYLAGVLDLAEGNVTQVSQ